MLLAVRKSKLPATALPQSKQRYARLAHGLRKCSGKQCGQPDEERYACRRKRPRACKMRHGRERPCLKTPLRFESWLAPVQKRSATGAAGRSSLSGRASRHRYACRRKRPRACKLRHGRERPCLETPLRSESKACPCASAPCNWRCRALQRQRAGKQAVRYASRRKRPRACCRMRQGRERPCLKTPLRFESKACPCASVPCNFAAGRSSVSGRASRQCAMHAGASASVHAAGCGKGVSAHA